MDKKAVIERIMRNLDFDLETEPAHKRGKEKSATSTKTDSLNLKIRVRKKENERCNQGFITNFLSEPEMVLRKVRLVNSDNTIMSFDMFMEAELDENTSVKPRKTFGSCLGATEDDDGPYNKADGKLRQQFPLTKNTYDPFRDTPTRGETTFLGQKCKPGGCLDPPFGEDRYAYMPRVPEPPRKREAKKPQKPIKIDRDDNVDIRHIKTPAKEDSIHINIPTKPPKTQVQEPIINIYKTESPKSSLLMYPPSIENKSPRISISSENKGNVPSEHKMEKTRIPSRDKDRPSSQGKFMYPIVDESNIAKTDKVDSIDESFSEDKYEYSIDHENNKLTPKEVVRSDKDSITKDKLIDDKSKYPFVNEKPKTKMVPENKLYKKKPSIEEKYRHSVDDSINSFFSPPKGIKRESSQRDSLKRHSHIPITENKPIEYVRPPSSVSLDLVPLEQNAEPKSDGDTYTKDKMPEHIESEPDQQIIEQQQIILPPIIVPLPDALDTNQNEKKDLKRIDSPATSLNEKSTESPEEPDFMKDDILSSPNNTLENDLASEHIEGIDNDISKVPSPAQFDLESISKEATNTPLEKSPSPTNQSTNGDNYEDQSTSSKFSGQNEEILDNTIHKQIKPENFEEIKVDSYQVIKHDLQTNIAKSSEDVAENAYLNSQQDPKNISLDQNGSKLTFEKSSDISIKPSLTSEVIEEESIIKQDINEISKIKELPPKPQIISPIILHDEIKPKLSEIQQVPENVIKSSNDKDSLNKDIISDIKQSTDKVTDILNDIPHERSTYPITPPAEIFDKNITKTEPDKEYSPMLIDIQDEDTQWKLLPKITPETLEAPKIKNEPNDNTKTKLPPNNIHNKYLNPLLLDLTFHSYQNDRKERILKTLDSKHEVKRYPNDSIIIIKSQVKLPSDKEHKFVIPIDSEHDMSIDLTKRTKDNKSEENKVETEPVPKYPQADANNLKTKEEISTKRESDPRTHKKAIKNEAMDNLLTDIYEQELVPLQKIIRSLKQEIDYLAAQQTAYKKKVTCLKASTLPPLIHSNKRCSM